MTKTEYRIFSQLFYYYLNIIENNSELFNNLSYRCQAPQLISLCKEAIENGSSYSVKKMYRWVEFIQNILICLNLVEKDK